MKTRAVGFVMALVVGSLLHPVHARERVAPKATAAKGADKPASPVQPGAPSGGGAAPLARFLVQLDGSPDTVTLPLAQIIQAATGKTVRPVDRANPPEAAFLKELGGALDGILPLMNKPDSPARLAPDEGGTAEIFAAVLATKLNGVGGSEVIPAPGAPAGATPTFCVAAAGKTYCVGFSFFSTTDHDGATPKLRLHPEQLTGLPLGENNACLLVAVETNGKIGKEAAFLNWELIDAAQLPVRAAMTFVGTQADMRVPGAKLDDGRKGRD